MSKSGKSKAGLLHWLTEAQLAVYLLDDRRRIRFFNRGCESLLKVAAGEMIGKVTSFGGDHAEQPDAMWLTRLGAPPACYHGQQARIPLVIDNSLDQIIRFYPLINEQSLVETILAIIVHPLDEDQNFIESLSRHRKLQLLDNMGSHATQGHKKLIGESILWMKICRQIQLAGNTKMPMVITGPQGSGKSHLAGHICRIEQRAIVMEPTLEYLGHEPIVIDCQQTRPDDVILEILRIQSAWEQHGSVRSGKAAVHPDIIIESVDLLARDGQSILCQLFKGVNFNSRLIVTTRRCWNELQSTDIFTREFAFLVSGLVIELPALIERGSDDLLQLAHYFLEQQNGINARQLTGLSSGFSNALIEYHWPGNIEELEDVIITASQTAQGIYLEKDDLPFRFRMGIDAQQLKDVGNEPGGFQPVEITEYLERHERELIQNALSHFGENKAAAARALGMTRARFYRRIEQLGL